VPNATTLNRNTSPSQAQPPELRPEDYAILEKAVLGGTELAFLFFARTQIVAGTQRGSELELCRQLGALVNNDPLRIDSLFRHSELLSSQWDEPRGGTTYGGLVILEAIQENLGLVPKQSAEIIRGIFREGQFGVLCGYYSVGKSPLVQDLAFHVRNGLAWLGREVTERDVILIDFETQHAEFARNMLRLLRRYPGTWTPPIAHLLSAKVSSAGVLPLQDLSRSYWQDRLKFIRKMLAKSNSALIVIDPAEQFFRFNRNRSSHILTLFQELRELLNAHPRAAILLVMNLQKLRRRRHPPNLLKEPLLWLEDNAGDLDLLNRCDVRLGFDWHDDNQIRVLHGARRSETMAPILVRQVGTEGEYCGFELVPAEIAFLELELTPRQLAYWRQLPTEFRFKQIVGKGIVPKSSLSRLIKCSQAMGMLDSREGKHRKR
jgi:hypothetical protein